MCRANPELFFLNWRNYESNLFFYCLGTATVKILSRDLLPTVYASRLAPVNAKNV